MPVLQTIALTGNYQATVDILAGVNFVKKRQATLWVLNDTTLNNVKHSFYFNRFYLNLQVVGGGTIQFPLNGIVEKSYRFFDYLASNSTTRTILLVYDHTNDIVNLYASATGGSVYLIGQSVYEPINGRNWHLPTATFATAKFCNFCSTDSPPSYGAFDEMSGTEANFLATNNATLPGSIATPRVPSYRATDYPSPYFTNGLNGNITGIADIFTQEALCLQPPWKNGTWLLSGAKPLLFAFDLPRMIGWDGENNNPNTQQITDTINFNNRLVIRGYSFHVIYSMQNFYQFRAFITGLCYRLIQYAVANPPQTIVSVGTACAQMTAGGGADTPGVPFDCSTSVYTDADSIVDSNKTIYGVYATALKALLGDVPLDHFEDGEGEYGIPNYSSATQPAASQSFADKWNRYLSVFRAAFTNIVSWVYDKYPHGFIDTNGLREPQVASVNVPRLQSSNSIYTERPELWYETDGEERGLLFAMQVKYLDLAVGKKFNHTVIGYGWSNLPEINLIPAQAYCHTKLLLALGVDSSRLGFFYKGVAQPGVLWYFQTIVLSDCFALTTFDRDIMDNGSLLDGDMWLDQTVESQNSKQHWTGSALVPFFAWKWGTQYLFVYGYEALTNYSDQADTYGFSITVDGHTHYFNTDKAARRQGNWIRWNSADPSTYIFRDQYHQLTHPVYWASADVTPPVITNSPGSANVILACEDTSGLATALAFVPTATDDTDPNPSMQVVVTETAPGECPNVITRTFTFTDVGGNVSDPFVQTITIHPSIIVPPNPTIMVPVELTDVQSNICCLGKLGNKKRVAEKKGDSATMMALQGQIFVLENIIEALECYTAGSEVNCLTALEIEALKESAHAICGCCPDLPATPFVQPPAPGISHPTCGLNDLQAAMFSSVGVDYLLAIDRTGSTNYLLYQYTWFTSPDGNVYTQVAQGIGIHFYLFGVGVNYLRVTIQCPNSTDSLTITVGKSDDVTTNSYEFNDYFYYEYNHALPPRLVLGVNVYVAQGDTFTLLHLNHTEIEAKFASQHILAGQPFYPQVDTKDWTFADVLAEGDGYYDLLNIQIRSKLIGDSTFTTDRGLRIEFIPYPFILGNSTICAGGHVTLTARYGDGSQSANYTSWQWKLNGVDIPGATAFQLNTMTAGSYTVVGMKGTASIESSAFVAVIQTNNPMPKMVPDFSSFLNPADLGKYYYDTATNTAYFASTNAGLLINLVDLGFYSGGYPTGTTVEIYDAGGTHATGLIVTVADFENGTNNFFNITDGYSLKVCLPIGSGGCCSMSPVLNLDFITCQDAQVNSQDYQITNCLAGSPNPPTGCGWSLYANHCSTGVADNKSTFVRDKRQYNFDCSIKDPFDVITINVVDNGNGTWTLSTNGIGVAGNNFTTNATWYDELTNTVIGTGLSVTVNHKGCFGFNGGVGYNNFISTPVPPTLPPNTDALVGFGNFLAFIP
jgi:hypothetical protein